MRKKERSACSTPRSEVNGMIQFCDNCDSVLYPRRKAGKYFLACRSCGRAREVKKEAIAEAYKCSVAFDHEHRKTYISDENQDKKYPMRDDRKIKPRII